MKKNSMNMTVKKEILNKETARKMLINRLTQIGQKAMKVVLVRRRIRMKNNSVNKELA